MLQASQRPGRALSYATPPEWAVRQRQPGCTAELLLDQGHLEKKAAAGAVTFLFRVPYDRRWQRGLSALAREELVHYERTLKLLEGRGIEFAPLRQVEYASGLKDGIDRDMPLRLVDELLVAAIIEARSCERMTLLAGALRDFDAELAGFYAELVAAEERHEALYYDIACSLAPEREVFSRWQRLCEHEAAVLRDLPWAPRLHSGAGGGGAGGGDDRDE